MTKLYLPELPVSPMFIEETMTIEWQEFFRSLFERAGGIDAPTINELLLMMLAEFFSTPKNWGVEINNLLQIIATGTLSPTVPNIKDDPLLGNLFVPSIPVVKNDPLLENLYAPSTPIIKEDPVLVDVYAPSTPTPKGSLKIEVADITNPTELAVLSGGIIGTLLLVYEDAITDLFTQYVWGNSGTANSPYIVAGVGGFWYAIGGRYTSGISFFSADAYFGAEVGIGTASPSSKLHVVGDIKGDGLQLEIEATFDHTTTENDFTILADASSFDIIISLDASAKSGQIHNIKCIDDTNTCTVSRNGNNIDGVASDIVLIKDESITVQADNSNDWWII